MWTTARHNAHRSAAAATTPPYQASPVQPDAGTGAGGAHANAYAGNLHQFDRKSPRRPVAIIEGTVVDADNARGAAQGPSSYRDVYYSATRHWRSISWPTIRWTVVGFIIGVAFWHFVGFWHFIGQVVLDGNTGTARASTQTAAAAHVAAVAPDMLAAPVIGCTALVRNPSSGNTIAAPCPPKVAQTLEGSGIRRSNLIARANGPQRSGVAAAQIAPPLWSATVVQTSPNR